MDTASFELDHQRFSRRQLLRRSAVVAGGAMFGTAGLAKAEQPAAATNTSKSDGALISITLDLEMSRNFPQWDDTEWDYQKGNLTETVKRYAVDACRRVKQRGGVIHTFVVGQVLEHPNVDWLKSIAAEGHPIGNHTYDHVYVLAQNEAQIQYRFARSPWLLGKRSITEVIRDNIALCSTALKQRVGVDAAGFRTPGGFSMGLSGREDVQEMLLQLGFDWVSSRYPAHAGIDNLHGTENRPSREAYQNIVAAQVLAQPFVYPSGLIEVPMSPISDIGAFRNGRWQFDYFLHAIRIAIDWVIQNNGVFDFLAHPSCLGVVDPGFQALDLICDMVQASDGRAKIVDLSQLAKRAPS